MNGTHEFQGNVAFGIGIWALLIVATIATAKWRDCAAPRACTQPTTIHTKVDDATQQAGAGKTGAEDRVMRVGGSQPGIAFPKTSAGARSESFLRKQSNV